MIWLLTIVVIAWLLVGLLTTADPYAALAYIFGSVFGVALAFLLILVGVEKHEKRGN